MDIPTDNHRPSDSSSNSKYKRSSATYHTVHFGPLLFRNATFPTISLPPFAIEIFPPISVAASDSPAYFKVQARPVSVAQFLVSCFPSRRDNLYNFSRFADYCSYRLLNTRKMMLLQEALCINETEKRVVGL